MDHLQSDVKATDVLANERTFLAYIRTALAFIAFGFVLARFGLFVEQLARMTNTATSGVHYSTLFGIMMAAVGVAVGLLGGWRYAVTDKALRSGVVLALPRTLGYVVTLFVVAIGLLVAIYLLWYF